MDKNEELQGKTCKDSLVQLKELANLYKKDKRAIVALLNRHNIKAIKHGFYSRRDCKKLFNSLEKKQEELQSWIANDKYIRPIELSNIWGVGVTTVCDFLKKNNILVEKKIHGGHLGFYVFYNKKSYMIARENAGLESNELKKWLNDSRYVRIETLAKEWSIAHSSVSSFLRSKNIHPSKTLHMGTFGTFCFFDKNVCMMERNSDGWNRQDLQKFLDKNSFVQRQDLVSMWGLNKHGVRSFLYRMGIKPVKSGCVGRNHGKYAFYDRAECERARPFINQPEKKEVEKMEEKQMELPEPKEQTPDIIPADTIDLFTMPELESELKKRGVELTVDVRAKINASDMPEMQHIATMLRGNTKTIAIRLSALNDIAGQLKPAKKLSFYEKVQAICAKKEPPTPVESEPKNEGAIDIAALSKEQALDFIRNRLRFKERIYLRGVTGNHDMTKEHRRFDMSGYDRTTRGDCTLHNMAILNEFADLGIYDYTDYLFLDFYKGQPTLYMRYFKDDKHLDFELCGWTTSEIIYFIFQKTILSGKNKRRRD